ncbi:hypothetical protein LINPERPRIM_LOCUS36918 [Linum perenne]
MDPSPSFLKPLATSTSATTSSTTTRKSEASSAMAPSTMSVGSRPRRGSYGFP